MDPREVLDLIARGHAAEALRDLAPGTDPDGEPALDPDGDDTGLVHLTRLPARTARTVAIPGDLPGPLLARLELLGVSALYEHQAEALARYRDGEHLAIATGTASGKTLCYQLPVIEDLLTTEFATALYLAPTKALARDQLRSLRALRLPQVRAAALDGDTPRPEREAIRRTANWILTNPDLLHHSLLPGHRFWGDFLHRLTAVVIDEAHVARGVFGGHIALVLRRLRRLCERYGAEPRFVLASATIGNPAEHARALTGVDATPIVRDGSPRGAIDIGLWQPPFIDREAGTRRSLLRESGDLLASFVGAGVQTLTFTSSRRGAELIALFARERLATDDPLRKAIRAYRGGYLPEERRELELQLRDGSLQGVAATEALELGIDVSGLDAVVLAGWPGTAAAFWQRLGRAGRAGGAAAGVLVAADDPLDQYLVHHPDDLFARAPEDAILDPTNPYLLAPHLRCACHEAPMTTDEAVTWFGPGAADALTADVADGVLRVTGGRHHWKGRRSPSGTVSLRSAGAQTIRIVDVDTGALIGDVDEARAYSQVHSGAVYLHQGRRYEIADLDLAQGLALAGHAPDIGHATRARRDTDIRVIAERDGADWGEVATRLGTVEVTTQVIGYDVIRPGTNELLDQVELDLAPTTLQTVAVWYTIPEAILAEAGIGEDRVPGSLHAAEHAAIGILPLIALCDRWDIGGLSTARHLDTGLPTVFVYDGYPGGAGLAERSFLRLAEHLGATRTAVADCGCGHGCPSCIQSPKCGNANDPLDKAGAVSVLEIVLSRAPEEPSARAAR